MSKERLEDLLNEFELACRGGDYEISIQLKREISERVQVLEKRLKIYQKRSWYEDYEKVAKQNKRYREKINVALALLESVPFREPEASGAVKHLNKALEGEE